jgi:hypothetical protein
MNAQELIIFLSVFGVALTAFLLGWVKPRKVKFWRTFWLLTIIVGLVMGVGSLFGCTAGSKPKVTADQVAQRMTEQVAAQQPGLALKCSAAGVDRQGFGSYACDLVDADAADHARPTHFVVEVTPDGNGWQIKGDTGTTPGN